jgi:hypothetical protein
MTQVMDMYATNVQTKRQAPQGCGEVGRTNARQHAFGSTLSCRNSSTSDDSDEIAEIASFRGSTRRFLDLDIETHQHGFRLCEITTS